MRVATILKKSSRGNSHCSLATRAYRFNCLLFKEHVCSRLKVLSSDPTLLVARYRKSLDVLYKTCSDSDAGQTSISVD